MIPKQTKKIWKWTKYDELVPVINFMDGLEVESPTKNTGFKDEGGKKKDK